MLKKSITKIIVDGEIVTVAVDRDTLNIIISMIERGAKFIDMNAKSYRAQGEWDTADNLDMMVKKSMSFAKKVREAGVSNA